MTEPSDELKALASKVAQRFWLDQLWGRLVGRKVKFVRAVQRGVQIEDGGGEQFVIPAGSTGTAVEPFLTPEGAVILAVKLDNPPPELSPYEGEVHWHEDHVADLEADLEWL